MSLLADYSNAALVWIFGCVFLFVILGLLSFWPAARGHWSALIMAAPSILLGGFLSWNLISDSRPDHALPDMWFLFPAPLAVGVVAILMWASVRYSDYSE
jgi:hypothetical protein